ISGTARDDNISAQAETAISVFFSMAKLSGCQGQPCKQGACTKLTSRPTEASHKARSRHRKKREGLHTTDDQPACRAPLATKRIIHSATVVPWWSWSRLVTPRW